MSAVRQVVGRTVRRTALVALGTAAACAGGCATAVRTLARPYQVTASGLELPEQRLRDAFAGARWADALAQVGDASRGGPSDPLLRDLYHGSAAYYAGRYVESAAAFARADALAEARYTKRVSRAALALATNDRALPYVPGQNERLFARYYAALASLHAGDAENAAVEARRLALQLQAYDAGRDALDVSARSVLRYVTGAVFELTGDREDAGVAYRNAAALGAAVDTLAAEPRASAAARGDVVLVIERGFVAHRVDERLHLELGGGALEPLAPDRPRGDAGPRETGAPAAAMMPNGDSALDTADAELPPLLVNDEGLWAGELPTALTLGGTDSVPSITPAAPPPVVASPSRGMTYVRGTLAGAAVGVAGDVGRIASGVPASATPRGGQVGRHWGDARWSRGIIGRRLAIAWPAYRRPASLGPFGGLLLMDAVALGGAEATRRGTGPAVSSGAAAYAGSWVQTTTAETPAATPSTPALVVTRGEAVAPLAALRADLSLAVAGDFKRDRAKLLARLIVRAGLRAALAERAGKKHHELGDLVASLGNAVEHADTRSWQLLPAELRVVRVRLPAGRHTLAVDDAGRRVVLGVVDVAPGTLRVVSARLWDDGARVTAAGLAPIDTSVPPAAPPVR